MPRWAPSTFVRTLLLAASLTLAPPSAEVTAAAELTPTMQLFEAVENDDLDGVRASITNGADIRAKNAKGQMPADVAVERGHFRIAQYLLTISSMKKRGASKGPVPSSSVEGKAESEPGPLMASGQADAREPPSPPTAEPGARPEPGLLAEGTPVAGGQVPSRLEYFGPLTGYGGPGQEPSASVGGAMPVPSTPMVGPSPADEIELPSPAIDVLAEQVPASPATEAATTAKPSETTEAEDAEPGPEDALEQAPQATAESDLLETAEPEVGDTAESTPAAAAVTFASPPRKPVPETETRRSRSVADSLAEKTPTRKPRPPTQRPSEEPVPPVQPETPEVAAKAGEEPPGFLETLSEVIEIEPPAAKETGPEAETSERRREEPDETAAPKLLQAEQPEPEPETGGFLSKLKEIVDVLHFGKGEEAEGEAGSADPTPAEPVELPRVEVSPEVRARFEADIRSRLEDLERARWKAVTKTRARAETKAQAEKEAREKAQADLGRMTGERAVQPPPPSLQAPGDLSAGRTNSPRTRLWKRIGRVFGEAPANPDAIYRATPPVGASPTGVVELPEDDRGTSPWETEVAVAAPPPPPPAPSYLATLSRRFAVQPAPEGKASAPAVPPAPMQAESTPTDTFAAPSGKPVPETETRRMRSTAESVTQTVPIRKPQPPSQRPSAGLAPPAQPETPALAAEAGEEPPGFLETLLEVIEIEPPAAKETGPEAETSERRREEPDETAAPKLLQAEEPEPAPKTGGFLSTLKEMEDVLPFETGEEGEAEPGAPAPAEHTEMPSAEMSPEARARFEAETRSQIEDLERARWKAVTQTRARAETMAQAEAEKEVAIEAPPPTPDYLALLSRRFGRRAGTPPPVEPGESPIPMQPAAEGEAPAAAPPAAASDIRPPVPMPETSPALRAMTEPAPAGRFPDATLLGREGVPIEASPPPPPPSPPRALQRASGNVYERLAQLLGREDTRLEGDDLDRVAGGPAPEPIGEPADASLPWQPKVKDNAGALPGEAVRETSGAAPADSAAAMMGAEESETSLFGSEVPPTATEEAALPVDETAPGTDDADLFGTATGFWDTGEPSPDKSAAPPEDPMDKSTWTVKSVEKSDSPSNGSGQPLTPVKGRTLLKGVALTLGRTVALGVAMPATVSDDPDRTESCLSKAKGTVHFCIQQVDWPSGLESEVQTSSVLYQGAHAIARYDHGVATRYHALFPAEVFDSLATYYQDRFGPPAEVWKRTIAPLASPRRDNPTVTWRSQDQATGRIVTLEIRQFDDTRGGFPDMKRGAVMLYTSPAPPIFPQVSSLELMRLKRPR